MANFKDISLPQRIIDNWGILKAGEKVFPREKPP